MLKPLKQWICDKCHQTIQSPEEAILIWKCDQNDRCHDFRIVHHMRCDLRSEFIGSCHLQQYLGHDGLSKLLGFLEPGPLMRVRGIRGSEIRDTHEYVDLVRRLQIPHYEAARRMFHREEVQERFFDSTEEQPYTLEKLKQLAGEAG